MQQYMIFIGGSVAGGPARPNPANRVQASRFTAEQPLRQPPIQAKGPGRNQAETMSMRQSDAPIGGLWRPRPGYA